MCRARSRDAEADIDAARAMALVDDGGGLLVGDARENARRDFDHGGCYSEFGGGRRHLEPDQPAADDEERPAAIEMRLERARLRFGAQVVDAVAPRWKHRQYAIDRAGGEHQRVIGDARARLRHHRARGAVDLVTRTPRSKATPLRIALGAGDRRVVGRRLARQHGLRQRRLLVGLVALVAEQHDLGGCVLLLRSHCRGDPGRSAANDYDLARRVHAALLTRPRRCA